MMNIIVEINVVVNIVEIFKTDVFDQVEANQLIAVLMQQFPGCRINFDLDDCDKILRIEGENLLCDRIKMIVNENGFLCEVLE